ncbi:hypothetical protein IMZ48_04150 [Candidatus Bathyarchaeota archaeon]|nr:hypothetical protein [Candidatus Bathyarchaeota archaeon]
MRERASKSLAEVSTPSMGAAVVTVAPKTRAVRTLPSFMMITGENMARETQYLVLEGYNSWLR